MDDECPFAQMARRQCWDISGHALPAYHELPPVVQRMARWWCAAPPVRIPHQVARHYETFFKLNRQTVLNHATAVAHVAPPRIEMDSSMEAKAAWVRQWANAPLDQRLVAYIAAETLFFATSFYVTARAVVPDALKYVIQRVEVDKRIFMSVLCDAFDEPPGAPIVIDIFYEAVQLECRFAVRTFGRVPPRLKTLIHKEANRGLRKLGYSPFFSQVNAFNTYDYNDVTPATVGGVKLG